MISEDLNGEGTVLVKSLWQNKAKHKLLSVDLEGSVSDMYFNFHLIRHCSAFLAFQIVRGSDAQGCESGFAWICIHFTS